MNDDTLHLRPATAADLRFLLALRRATMGPHLRRAGAPLDAAGMLARVRHRFEDARIVWLGGRRVGLFKVTRGPGRWHVAAARRCGVRPYRQCRPNLHGA